MTEMLDMEDQEMKMRQGKDSLTMDSTATKKIPANCEDTEQTIGSLWWVFRVFSLSFISKDKPFSEHISAR